MGVRLRSSRYRGREDMRRMWSAPVLIKYWLLQLPGTVFVALILYLLRDTLGLPMWMLWSIIGTWVTKDVILYPIVWRSYDPNPVGTAHSLEGARGLAVDRLAPTGYVRVQGELWRAELTHPEAAVERGMWVRVNAVRGLTLLVEPEQQE